MQAIIDIAINAGLYNNWCELANLLASISSVGFLHFKHIFAEIVRGWSIEILHILNEGSNKSVFFYILEAGIITSYLFTIYT